MAGRKGDGARPSLDDILRILREHLPELREKYAVKSLAVFGSYVRGQQRKRSDLDLLVEFAEAPRPRITLIEYVGLQNELSDLLGVKVDLVEKKGLKPRIGERVLREALPV